MWTVTLSNTTEEVTEASALYQDETTKFGFSSTIKVGELESFANRCKEELAKFQEKNQAITRLDLKNKLESLLNS